MKRNHLFAWALGIAVLLPVLVACGGAPPATSSATTAPAPAATTAPAPAASATIGDMPQNLRTDLKGQTIQFIGDAAGPSSDFEKKYAAVFEQITGIKVEVLQGEQSATDRLAQYRQQFGAQSSDTDVYMIDVIWPGILADHAVDLTNALQSQHADYFERIVKNNTVGNCSGLG